MLGFLVSVLLIASEVQVTPQDTRYGMSCHAVDMQGLVKNAELTEMDSKTLARAKVHCPEWRPEKPCVKIFRKKTETHYEVICGYPRSKAG